MEQDKGFEPSPSVWKTDMLAVEHQSCILPVFPGCQKVELWSLYLQFDWSEWRDSNSRPRDPKSRALAKLSYTRMVRLTSLNGLLRFN